MSALATVVGNVPAASPVDSASVGVLAQAMWDASEKPRAEDELRKRQEQKAREAEQQRLEKLCHETFQHLRTSEFESWLAEYLSKKLAFLRYCGAEIRMSGRVVIDIKHRLRMKGHGKFIHENFTPNLRKEILERFAQIQPDGFSITFSRQ